MSDDDGKRALVVEDEPSISMLCRRVLINEGYDVDIVDTGMAAENAVSQREYDILLCDIRLPVESGYEFYIWLRQEYPRMSKHVIFMTGGMMDGEIMDLLKRSGQPYLLKPFRPDELKKTLAAFTK